MTASEITSIASTIVVAISIVVALFRENLRNRFLPPRLEITLSSPEVGATQLGKERRKYRMLRVHNRRATSPVHNVRVYLISLRRTELNEPLWKGEAMMWWRYERNSRVATHFAGRTIGAAPSECDMCSVGEQENHVRLEVMYRPINLPEQLEKATPYELTFKAMGDEAVSPHITVEVLWNGQWTDDDNIFFRKMMTVIATGRDGSGAE